MNQTVDIVTEKIRRDMYEEKLSPPPASEVVELAVGDTINVSGVGMSVVNVAGQSVTLRPLDEPLYLIVGVPMKIHKWIKGDFVFRPVDKVTVKRADGANRKR